MSRAVTFPAGFAIFQTLSIRESGSLSFLFLLEAKGSAEVAWFLPISLSSGPRQCVSVSVSDSFKGTW